MIYRFLRVQTDLTTNKAPSFWKTEVENRDAAIKLFCQEYGLTVAEIAGEAVWFYTEDNAMLRYLVDEGRDK